MVEEHHERVHSLAYAGATGGADAPNAVRLEAGPELFNMPCVGEPGALRRVPETVSALSVQALFAGEHVLIQRIVPA
jgi:hypothetical protein